MTEVADERRDRIVQSHIPSQLRHKRLHPFGGVVAKTRNRLGKEGHDLPWIPGRLPSQGLNDPKGMAQIEFLEVVFVPVSLAILPQHLPALLGVPAEHVEPLTEGYL